jgi:hypothetical protein
MGVTRSQQNNITSPNGNSLAVFIEGETGIMLIKDVNGNIEPITNYLPTIPYVTGVYGSFYDTTTQTALGNDTPTPMKYNSTDIENGVSIVDDSKITVSQSGVYNLQFSAQVDRVAGNGVVVIDIWLRKNGLDVANSDTKVTLSGNANQAKIVASWNFFVELNAGQNVELMWNTPTTNIKLVALPEDLIIPHPEVPSVILTMNKIS